MLKISNVYRSSMIWLYIGLSAAALTYWPANAFVLVMFAITVGFAPLASVEPVAEWFRWGGPLSERSRRSLLVLRFGASAIVICAVEGIVANGSPAHVLQVVLAAAGLAVATATVGMERPIQPALGAIGGIVAMVGAGLGFGSNTGVLLAACLFGVLSSQMPVPKR
jgi:hypothetical protein